MQLRVSIHGVTVGVLERQATGLVTFRFEPSYLEMVERPVLGRWYEDHIDPSFVEKSPQGWVPPFFHNYLPEPNSALRELLARRAGVPMNRDFALLAALGLDLPGAVVVQPRTEQASDEPVDSPRASADASPHGPLRFSLAGMQLKFSIAQQAHKLTLPVTGVGGRYILKMPSRSLDHVPANEFSTMTWARESGIVTPDVRLVSWREVDGLPVDLDYKEDQALLVSRFDRPVEGGPRVHQEDFAQVLGVRPTDKYGRESQVTFDRIGKIVARVCGAADFEEFVRRLVFVVLCANPDAHLKNWSLLYPDGRRPRLAPAYDLVSTANYSEITTEMAHRLGGEWELGRVRAWHFGLLASRAGFAEDVGVRLAQESAQRARDAWRTMAGDLPFSPEQRAAVEKHLSKIQIP